MLFVDGPLTRHSPCMVAGCVVTRRRTAIISTSAYLIQFPYLCADFQTVELTPGVFPVWSVFSVQIPPHNLTSGKICSSRDVIHRVTPVVLSVA